MGWSWSSLLETACRLGNSPPDRMVSLCGDEGRRQARPITSRVGKSAAQDHDGRCPRLGDGYRARRPAVHHPLPRSSMPRHHSEKLEDVGKTQCVSATGQKSSSRPPKNDEDHELLPDSSVDAGTEPGNLNLPVQPPSEHQGEDRVSCQHARRTDRRPFRNVHPHQGLVLELDGPPLQF